MGHLKRRLLVVAMKAPRVLWSWVLSSRVVPWDFFGDYHGCRRTVNYNHASEPFDGNDEWTTGTGTSEETHAWVAD